MTLINKTKHGRIFKCSSCSAIHVEFKNINFNLKPKQFRDFADFISDINPEEYEERNAHVPYQRKIFIPTGNQSINIILNKEELVELDLLFGLELMHGEEDVPATQVVQSSISKYKSIISSIHQNRILLRYTQKNSL